MVLLKIKKIDKELNINVVRKSNDKLKGFKNEVMAYTWKFKLGNDIKSCQ